MTVTIMDPVTELNNIIYESLQHNSLDILNEYLLSLENSSDILNGKLIPVFLRILKKRGKNEVKHLQVSCILTCLQHFVNTVKDPSKWEKLSEEISKICQLVFIISSLFIKDDELIQRVVTVITGIVESNNGITDNLFKFLVKDLLESSLCMTHNKHTRFHIMVLVGCLLQMSSRGIRTEILPNITDHLNDVSNFLIKSDDYETQLAVVEILARSLIFVKKHHNSWFTENPQIAEMFQKHQFLNFDPECRLFLNEVNESLGDQQKVFSVPSMVVCADDARMRKPADPAYTDFWVDFNLGSRSMSFYYQLVTLESWDLMTVPQERVVRAVARDSACQSKQGEKIEAVKFELIINPSDPTPNMDLPKKLKIYPRKDMFMKIEPIVRQIFKEKYEWETCETSWETSRNERTENTDKENQTFGEKSYIVESTFLKATEDKEGEGGKTIVADKSKSESSQGSEKSDEDIGEYSPFLRLKEKRLQERKNNTLSSSEEVETVNNHEEPGTNTKFTARERTKTPKKGQIISGLVNIDDATNKNICLGNNKSSSIVGRSSSLKGDIGAKQRKFTVNENISESDNGIKRQNTSELNRNLKKKRLYSFETSNVEDIVMSSQEQALSIEIPSYKYTRKETFAKPQPVIDRKNISFSYITNKKKDKLVNDAQNELQNQFNFDEAIETQKPPSDDDSSGSPSHQIFKDLPTKLEASTKISKNKFFSNKTGRDVKTNKIPQNPQENNIFGSKSKNSDFDSPHMMERAKCHNTYARSKPKRPWKRIKVTPVESSDSGSEYVPPSKLLKENNNLIKGKTPIKTRFADRVVKDKIDPIRDNVFTDEMKPEAVYDFEEPTPKPKDIFVESLMVQTKAKNSNAGKKKATRQPNKKPMKKPQQKKPKQDTLKTLPMAETDCKDVVCYEPAEEYSPINFNDLMDTLCYNDEQKKSTLMNRKCKLSDMIQVVNSVGEKVHEQLLLQKKLGQKEREMIYATLLNNTQTLVTARYSKLSKIVEFIIEEKRKELAMFENLQKEMAEPSDIKAELKGIVKKLEKTFSSFFQGFGGYLKNIILPFIQRNPIE